MKSIDIVSKIVAREGEAKASPSKGIQSINLSDYLLKSVWDKVFEVRTDSQGTEYIFGKLPIVTQYGITMYSGDGVDIPSLASGLPFDGRTIWYNPDTQQIEVIGGTGGGSGEGVSNFWDLSGIPSWITISKPKYTYTEIEGTPDLSVYALKTQIPSLSGYATESWVTKQNYATKATTLSGYGITDAYTKTNVDDLLKAYVTLGGTQTITGEKNFVGGLKVNGSPIYYDTEKKYWKLEGDLLVTGGVTMYGSDSSFTPSTIMDAILYDSATLGINSNGQLYVKGGSSGGGLDITALQNYLTQNSYLNVTSGDNRYLQLSGGTIYSSVFYGLRINSKDSSVSRSAIMFSYNDSNKSQFGWDGYSGWGTYMYDYSSRCVLSIKNDGTPYFGVEGSTLNTILHSGNYSSYALPLSGGTLSGNLTIQNKTVDVITLYRDDSNNAPSVKFTNNADGTLGYLGIAGSSSSIGVQPFFMDKNATIYKIWHSGNFTPSNYLLTSSYTAADVLAKLKTVDGSGSGLDADLLDGKHDGYVIAESLRNRTNDSSSIVLYSATRTDNTWPRSIVDNGYGLMISSNNTTGYIATLNSNVASATKLQTARTLWGQSFDGTGNVDGALTINKATTSSGDYGACVLINGNYTETGFHRALSYENQKMVVGSTAAMYVGAKNTQYNGGFLGFKYVSANSSSNYMSIGLYAANDLLCVLGNGNIGIGTTNPSAKLEIESSNFYGLHINSKDSSVDRSAMVFKKDGVNKAQFGWDALSSMGVFMYSYPSSFYLGIKDDGSLVFGKYSINFSVDSSGNGLFYGGVTMYSQRSLKNVVDERGLSLSELSTIKPTRYTWKDGRDNRLHFGGIADDIQQVLPEVVYSTSDGILTMDYGNAAFAVASSLIQPVVDHEKRIAILEEENKQLRLEVERFKSA